MDENAFGILMCRETCDGAGAGMCDGAPSTCSRLKLRMRTPDYTLCSGVHVYWSEHSDSSFVYGFMILNYGFGTMTATT